MFIVDATPEKKTMHPTATEDPGRHCPLTKFPPQQPHCPAGSPSPGAAYRKAVARTSPVCRAVHPPMSV